ncbi:MAG: LacI family DNA-binding transcriptional regulator [Spirochaetia bacterium]|nr:LacI family DNA-binding transcriptional regulator [Spirochaetia bacterium]
MSRKEKARLSDVAFLAGVSESTVSRVLNRQTTVSSTTYKRVMDAAKQFGIEAELPRKAKKNMRNRVAIVIPDGRNPFFNHLTLGVEEVARKHDYDIVYFTYDNDIDRENDLFNVLLDYNFPGIILIPQGNDIRRVKELLAEDRSIVFADRFLEGIDAPRVLANNELGAYHSARYLLDLGHRKILYVGGSKKQSTEGQRFSGYCRALKENHIELDYDMVIEDSFEADKAYSLVMSALDSGRYFTAIFCADDMIAFGAMKAISDKGLSVPDDVSVVGYDDIPFAKYASLTTVRQPAIEIGRNAMTLLLDDISDRLNGAQEIILDASLIIRGSCSQPRSN